MSQPNSIFKKTNLLYIPLSIAIAHSSNFIINSSLSVWQEFPPKLPSSVYSSIFFIPLLLFTSLTFEPIQTKSRFYTLLSLALIFISIPLIFRNGNYSAALHNALVAYSSVFGLKMFLFLKLNRTYANDQKNSKEFKSYLWSLFNWRLHSYIIPPKSENSNEKENPLIIKSPTTSQINKKLACRFTIIITKWLIYELVRFIFIKNQIEIPDKAYQVRLVESLLKGSFPITMSTMLRYLNFVGIMYLWISFHFDFNTFIVAIFYRLFIHSTSDEKNYKPILIKSGILSVSEYVRLKEWIVSLLFNSKHVFSEPWMASSPRDFWSNRWQLLLSEIFKELGYLPTRNLFSPFVPRKISNMMGVLGALLVSAVFHEYLIIGQFDLWTGEHFFFFMIHGVIFVLWEAVFGYEDRMNITKTRRILKWFLLATIYLSVMPAFVEPMKRNFERLSLPSYFAKCHTN